MPQKRPRLSLLLLSLLALVLQGCLGFGNSNTTSIGTNSNGNQVSVVQNAFKGKIYATIGHNLYVITGDGQSHQIVGGGNIYDPTVSPDGTEIAFIQRYKDYSNLAYSSIRGGSIQVVLHGNGHFFANNGGFVHNTYHWFSEPAWSPDGSSLIFLSDLMKADYAHQCTGQDADMLDLQVFSVQLDDPSIVQAVAYAAFGGGGDRDPSYRPGHPDQIVYAHYSTLPSDNSNQVVQIFLADPSAIAGHPGLYCAGGRGSGIAISNPKDQDIQPAFSPDGKFIAYVRRDSSTQMSLHVMPVPENVTQNPNNRATEQEALQPYQKSTLLITGLYIGCPVWSPDNKQLAYITETNDSLDLWILNLRFDPQTGSYAVQGSPVQVTTGGVDGDSRIFLQ